MKPEQRKRLTSFEVSELARLVIGQAESLPSSQRYVVGIVGVPGAGKTTFAHGFTHLLNELSPSRIAVTVPMDGFHLSNEKLEELELLPLKGIPTTFDAHSFIALVEKIKAGGGETVWCPSFDRSIESTIQNSIEVLASDRIAIVEGNYLLLEEEPWNKLSAILSEIWFIEEDMHLVEQRLLDRHMSNGKNKMQAQEKVDSTDLPNARLIAASAKRASKILQVPDVDH